MIEQANGKIAERAGLKVEDAFTRLRTFARSNNRNLPEAAEAVVAGNLTIDAALRRRPRHRGQHLSRGA